MDNTDPNTPPRRNRRRQFVKREFDSSVPSPCIGVCWLDDGTGLCEGCLRSGEEIRDWMVMGREEKLQLLEVLEQRRKGQGA